MSLPSTLRKINDRTFTNCASLEQIDLPNGLETIGRHALRNTGIRSLVIPPSLREIGLLKLYDSAEPRTVRLSDNILGLGTFCYMHPEGRPMFLLPSVGACLAEFTEGNEKNIFWVKDSAKAVRWNDSECKSIQFAIIPYSVRELCSNAFERYKRLKEVIFEDGSRLEKIGNNSFVGSGLERIAIPSATKDIAPSAFQNCLRLKEIGQIRGQDIVKFALGRDGIYEFPPETTLVGGISLYDLREMS